VNGRDSPDPLADDEERALMERMYWAVDIAITQQKVVKDGDGHYVPDLLVAQAAERGEKVPGDVVVRRDDRRWAVLLDSTVTT